MRTHHAIKTRGAKFSHHCLCESVIRCLEEAEYDIVGPVRHIQNEMVRSKDGQHTRTPKPDGSLVTHHQSRFMYDDEETHPILSVQIPIIPQNGIKIETTFVTKNYSKVRNASLKDRVIYHLLCADFPISLDVPEHKGA